MLEKLGLIPVRIDLPFRLNHVNCFMAEGENGWTIIDAGLHNTYTVNRWEEVIGDKTVSDIIISHYHPDHFGYAGGLQQKTNARVSMSEIDAKVGLNVWTQPYIDELSNHYKTAGIPVEAANEMVTNTAEFMPMVTPYPEINHYLKDHEKIIIGRHEYEVIVTPGHSEGMVCFFNKEESVLLSADHILPRITPNISYWFHGDANPLDSYINSLQDIKKLDADFIIPSHGKPFHGANTRIDELIRHHEDRLEETLSVIAEPKSVFEACNELFQFQLTVHEMRFAVGETIAHLEYLRNLGACERTSDNGKWIYVKK